MPAYLQGPLSDVDALLLDIYSQIDEPDGMYAAARTQQAASQLALFEHEGAWDKALVSCDLMLPRGLATHTCSTSSACRCPCWLRDSPALHAVIGTNIEESGVFEIPGSCVELVCSGCSGPGRVDS